MTVGKFASQQAVALRLIAENGEVATLTRKARTLNSTKPWRVDSAADTTYSVSVVFLGNAKTPEPEDSQIQRENLEKVLIAGTGLTVTPDATTDTITRQNGDKYDIVSVETLQPNEDVILYTLMVAK